MLTINKVIRIKYCIANYKWDLQFGITAHGCTVYLSSIVHASSLLFDAVAKMMLRIDLLGIYHFHSIPIQHAWP